MATRLQARMSLWIALAVVAVLLALAVTVAVASASVDTLAGRRTPAPPIASLTQSGPIESGPLGVFRQLQTNPRVRFGIDPAAEPNPRVRFSEIAGRKSPAPPSANRTQSGLIASLQERVEVAGAAVQVSPLRLNRG